MADKKISALTGATTPLAGTEVLPIVQGSATVKVSVANLTAGRAISATELTLTTGNLIVSNGKGIDFSDTPGTGTSELLNDYEEGTWTPGQGAGLTVVGTFSSSGNYIKIGNTVFVTYTLTASTSIAAIGVVQLFSGLPYAASGVGGFGVGTNANGNEMYNFQASSSSGFLEGGNITATANIFGSVTYLTA
jgi:hypothetical protein